MIQRKQSLFLFVAVVLLLISMFSVTTVFTSESDKTTVEFSNFSCSTYFDDVESKTITSNVPQENKQQNPDVVVKSNYLYSVFAIMLFVSAVISVVAIIRFLASSPYFSSINCFKIRNAKAVSVVVPDLEITLTVTSLSLI